MPRLTSPRAHPSGSRATPRAAAALAEPSRTT
jgi:hypothetical protein